MRIHVAAAAATRDLVTAALAHTTALTIPHLPESTRWFGNALAVDTVVIARITGVARGRYGYTLVALTCVRIPIATGIAAQCVTNRAATPIAATDEWIIAVGNAPIAGIAEIAT